MSCKGSPPPALLALRCAGFAAAEPSWHPLPLPAPQADCLLGGVRGGCVRRPARCARCVGGGPQGGRAAGRCLTGTTAEAAVVASSTACSRHVMRGLNGTRAPLLHQRRGPSSPAHPPTRRSRWGGMRTPGPLTSISSGGGATRGRHARCTSAATREAVGCALLGRPAARRTCGSPGCWNGAAPHVCWSWCRPLLPTPPTCAPPRTPQAQT